jgi:hypothetical protein
VNVPFMRISVVKRSYWKSDPKPWKLYRPHRVMSGQLEGDYATQQEAWTAAERLAEHDLKVLLEGIGDSA